MKAIGVYWGGGGILDLCHFTVSENITDVSYVTQMGVGVSHFPVLKKRYKGSALLALRGGGWGSDV